MSALAHQTAVMTVVSRPTVRVASPWPLISVGTAQPPTTVGRPEARS